MTSGAVSILISHILNVAWKHPEIVDLRIGAESAAKEFLASASNREKGFDRPSTTCAFHKGFFL
jgi:hypothetical protein